MEAENATILGLVVLIIGAGVKEIFSWMSKKSIQSSETRFENLSKSIKEIDDKIVKIDIKVDELVKDSAEMYDWHDKSDQDGVKVWYVRQSLENALRDNAKATEAIAKNIELQTRLLEEMIQTQRVVTKEQSEMMKSIRDIERNLEDK
jgi:DNA-binding protein H-NS